MDNRKISDLTVDEFKIIMEEMFNAHDIVYQANKRSWENSNRQYGLDSLYQFQKYNGQT